MPLKDIFIFWGRKQFKNNKIWIEEDWTEDGMLRANIPKEDIVLAFYPSQKRAYTEFATGD